MVEDKQKKQRVPKHAALANFFQHKAVIVITKSGHWYLGVLRAIDAGGIVLTGVYRLQPVMTEEGEPVRDEELDMTLRKVLPFHVPTGATKYIVRKMYIPWGHIQVILRAKTEEEVKKEEAERLKELTQSIT